MNQQNIDDIYKNLKKLSNYQLQKLIIKLLEENEQLKEKVLIDELTNIYNRKVLSKNINYDVLVMCDIDNFKLINDKYGHTIGDKVLKEVALNLSKILRKEDILLRYGGDEFTILFRNCSIQDIKNKLDKFIENSLLNNDLNIKLTMSFGITQYIEGKEIDEAIIEADSALYNSKLAGKNTVTIYHKENIIEKKKAF